MSDDQRCKAEVWRSWGTWGESGPCNNRASMPSGFCRIHDPVCQKARRDKRGPTKFEREMEAKRNQRERFAALEAEVTKLRADSEDWEAQYDECAGAVVRASGLDPNGLGWPEALKHLRELKAEIHEVSRERHDAEEEAQVWRRVAEKLEGERDEAVNALNAVFTEVSQTVDSDGNSHAMLTETAIRTMQALLAKHRQQAGEE